jgi:protoporphyrinogen oxidase
VSFESSPHVGRHAWLRRAADGRGGEAHLAVIGGGVSGLAVGFYARQRGLAATVYEAQSRPGGLCVTHAHDGFLFDSGAHRLHDKDPEITRDVQALLGGSLRAVDRPSVIFDGGRLMRFPFQLTDVLWHLGPRAIARGALDLAAARMAPRGHEQESFASLAVRSYGRTVAERFLLGYTRKLWGLPCESLSSRASGGRLRGLDLRQFLFHTLFGRRRDRRSADGAFYYPVRGIGMLTEALAAGCGRDGIRTGAEVRRLVHDGTHVRAIDVAGVGRVAVDAVASTLPLEQLLARMDPPPPDGILRLAQHLTYRNLVLVALFLRKESVTAAATVYFPDLRVPFTRVTEPKNRSAAMSPPGHTSLVAEIPCGPEDSVWSADDADLVELLQKHLEGIGWVRGGEVLGSKVVRLRRAYPVLSLDLERSVATILRHLDVLGNLAVVGRNGRFEYGWLHDMLRSGKDLVASCIVDPYGTEAGVA